jgi:hypothetical protein
MPNLLRNPVAVHHLQAFEEGCVVLREKFPPSLFVRFYARHVQNQAGQLPDFAVAVPNENIQTGNIPGRNVGLIEIGVKLIQTFDAVALFGRQALTIFAYMVAMTSPGELLVSTIAVADPAVVWHHQPINQFPVGWAIECLQSIPFFTAQSPSSSNGIVLATPRNCYRSRLASFSSTLISAKTNGRGRPFYLPFTMSPSGPGDRSPFAVRRSHPKPWTDVGSLEQIPEIVEGQCAAESFFAEDCVRKVRFVDLKPPDLVFD